MLGFFAWHLGRPHRTATATDRLRDVSSRTVFWSFFGIRKGAAMRKDAVTIKPHQVILVAARRSRPIFVVALIVVVRADHP